MEAVQPTCQPASGQRCVGNWSSHLSFPIEAQELQWGCRQAAGVFTLLFDVTCISGAHVCPRYLFLFLVPRVFLSLRVADRLGHCQFLDLPLPKLPGIADAPAAEPLFARTSELGAKLPQRPVTPPAKDTASTQSRTPTTSFRNISTQPPMDYQDDPWSTPDLHKGHKHADETPKRNGGESTTNGASEFNGNGNRNGNGIHESPSAAPPSRTTSTFTTAAVSSTNEPDAVPSRETPFGPAQSPGGAWGGEYFAGGGGNATGSNDPFGLDGGNGGREPSDPRPAPTLSRTIGSGRTGAAVEENIVVTLLPEKEGMFMFQHHNYEVASARRGSKVIRRYSDFVWLLDCLHKRYPFRVLPLLPPKRVAGMHI